MTTCNWAALMLRIGVCLAVSIVARQSPEKSTQGAETPMLSKEKGNSKTILAIFRAIEERDGSKTSELFQRDFEIHWPSSLPYGGTSRGLEPRPHGWSATWEPLQPTDAERKMDASVIAAHGDDVV